MMSSFATYREHGHHTDTCKLVSLQGDAYCCQFPLRLLCSPLYHDEAAMSDRECAGIGVLYARECGCEVCLKTREYFSRPRWNDSVLSSVYIIRTEVAERCFVEIGYPR